MAESFGQLLRRFRTRAGLNISELAEAVGADRKSIAAWEHDRYVPRGRARLTDLIQVLRLTSAEAHLLHAAQRRHIAGSEPAAAGNRPDLPTRPAAQPGLALCHQLCPPVSDFVGRAAELDQLVRMLRTALDTASAAIIAAVQGMGGIGKTQLAYAVAHRLHTFFPDAQLVIDLRGSQPIALTAEQALQTVIRAFVRDENLPEDRPALEQYYRSVLYNRRVLIVADDARDADHVRPLIPPQRCALLITSRQRFTLPGMATVHLEQLNDEEAMTLLRSVCSRLSLAEAQAIGQACGYLPLALRVSGSMLRNNPALSLASYLARLADERQRLNQLRDPDDPGLDVVASLALSYAQLDRVTQQVFRQLGVLVADFATSMALSIVETAAAVDVEAALYLLLRRNLVMYDEQRARWRLHDLVRDLARRELEAMGEWEATCWRYAHATLHAAESIQDGYMAGREGILAALALFDTERQHIDAVRRWAAAHAGTPEGDRLLVADALITGEIGQLRYSMQHERIPQFELALIAARNLGDRSSEGRILNRLGAIYAHVGEIRQAITSYEEALTIARALGDRRSEGRALNNMGLGYWTLGETERAIAYFEQVLTIARAIGERLGEAIALNNLGLAAGALGQAARAISYHEQALALTRSIGDRHGEGIVLSELAQTYMAVGEPWHAIGTCTRALEIAREVRDRHEEAHIQCTLAMAYAALGDLAQAFPAFEQALAIFCLIGDRHGEAWCSWHLGLTLARQGAHERALPLMRACLAHEQEIGHARAAAHAAVLAQLEAGMAPAELLDQPSQYAVGQDEPIRLCTA